MSGREVLVDAGATEPLPGTLTVPEGAPGVVLFAHGSGSSRHSPRNRAVADHLNGTSLATLLVDLLTPAEEDEDRYHAHLRFDIDLLAGRLAGIVAWLRGESANLAIGLFGSSTGAAAALVTAARRPADVAAVVSRGGRPDLAGDALDAVRAPTLLIVGGRDDVVLGLNEEARRRLRSDVRLEVVPGAGHLFEEPGALEAVADLSARWFLRHLPGAGPAPPPTELR